MSTPADLLQEDNIRATTAKLISEAAKLNTEAAKLLVETSKLAAETQKLAREARWYPVIVATAFVGAVLALAKYMQ
jgi:hypothetical protein